MRYIGVVYRAKHDTCGGFGGQSHPSRCLRKVNIVKPLLLIFENVIYL